MRKVARYAFVADSSEPEFGNPADTNEWFDKTSHVVNNWLNVKAKDRDPEAEKIILTDGREAELFYELFETPEGILKEWSLIEPLINGSGRFATRIRLVRNAQIVVFACDLEVGQDDGIVAPMRFEAYCPNVVRDTIALEIPWSVGDTIVPNQSYELRSKQDATQLVNLLKDPRRVLPVVTISEHENSQLVPTLDRKLARDLSGLAVVIRLEKEAAWGVTFEMEKEWSCYNGAIRLYWPFIGEEEPSRHPRWTRNRLLQYSRAPEDAARRIRNQLRRKVLGVSTLSIREPEIIGRIRRVARKAEIDARVEQARGDQDFEGLAMLYSEENERLRLELEELEQENQDLKEDLTTHKQNLANVQLWAKRPTDEQEEFAPEVEVPPVTVGEAVLRAKEEFSDDLIFGDHVQDGVAGLADDAGPPEKIFDYLEGLAKLARACRSGPLGMTKAAWLEGVNIRASRESESTRNSEEEKRKRTWHDGEERRFFDRHLKPADGTSPDRCVRIYFQWNDTAKKVIVGWVGRHP